MKQRLECLEVQSEQAAPKACIIWLHGLGADAADFLPLAHYLTARYPLHMILPHAPERAITANAGMQMPAWYDFYHWDWAGPEGTQGIPEGEAAIQQLIATAQHAGFQSHQIILGGFSQGAALALYTGLRYPEILGGVIGLSGYLPHAAEIQNTVERPQLHAISQAASAQTILSEVAQASLPIFIAHGETDAVIPLWVAEQMQAALIKMGYRPEYHTYQMAHQVIQTEIDDLAQFIAQCCTF